MYEIIDIVDLLEFVTPNKLQNSYSMNITLHVQNMFLIDSFFFSFFEEIQSFSFTSFSSFYEPCGSY